MGHMQAMEMAAMADLDTALVWHLRSNHYPPVPLSMLAACKQAIDLAQADEWDELIDLPDGTTWRGEDQAPAWAIVEGHHLDAFIVQQDDEPACRYCGDPATRSDPQTGAPLCYGCYMDESN